MIEIMVTIMIITTLIGIAVPNFLRAREVSRSRACIKNLRTIAVAKEQYAMDNHLAAGATMPVLSGLCGNGTTDYIRGVGPVCPASGSYTVGDLSTDPTCSVGTNGANLIAPHILP